jgi:hypothetical protein
MPSAWTTADPERPRRSAPPARPGRRSPPVNVSVDRIIAS